MMLLPLPYFTSLILCLSLVPPLSIVGTQSRTDIEEKVTIDSVVIPSVTSPIVHFSLKKPDPNRGVVKLARHRSTTTSAVGPNAVLITSVYDEVCTEPCAVPVDVRERPVFYFIRDGQPISHGFRLNDLGGEITLKVKPVQKGLLFAGVSLAILVIGIPMWAVSVSRIWVADGPPVQGQKFHRIKKAKI